MDTIRRQAAAGELSELLGGVTVEMDRANRFHRFRTRAREVVASASAAEREVLERYAVGANAGLAAWARARLSTSCCEPRPRPWAVEDSIIVVYAMFLQLNDERARRDVRRGYVYRVVDEEVYAWLYPEGTAWDAR